MGETAARHAPCAPCAPLHTAQSPIKQSPGSKSSNQQPGSLLPFIYLTSIASCMLACSTTWQESSCNVQVYVQQACIGFQACASRVLCESASMQHAMVLLWCTWPVATRGAACSCSSAACAAQSALPLFKGKGFTVLTGPRQGLCRQCSPFIMLLDLTAKLALPPTKGT